MIFNKSVLLRYLDRNYFLKDFFFTKSLRRIFRGRERKNISYLSGNIADKTLGRHLYLRRIT